MRSRSLAPAALALATACASPPPVELLSELGPVRARTPADAAAGRERLERAARVLPALAPDLCAVPVELWIDAARPRWLPEHVDGATLRRQTPRVLLLPREPAEPGVELHDEATLEHELVHAWLGPSWDALPQALVEGLADGLSARARGPAMERLVRCKRLAAFLDARPIAWLVSFRSERGVGGRGCIGSFEADGWDVETTDKSLDELLGLASGAPIFRLDREDASVLYGLGTFLVERILAREGMEGLHALCASARFRGERSVCACCLWRAAGLAPPGSLAALRAEAAPELEQALQDFVAGDPDLARCLDELSAADEGPEAFLRRLEPRFWCGSTRAVDLSAGEPIEGYAWFREWAAARWPEPAPGAASGRTR